MQSLYFVGTPFYINSNSRAEGDDVILRTDSFTSQGRRTWLNDHFSLTKGTLTKYYLYVVNQAGLASVANIRLQIWRPTGVTGFSFTLVWDLRVTVSLTYTPGALYTVSSIYFY